jgi:hypothetical protein
MMSLGLTNRLFVLSARVLLSAALLFSLGGCQDGELDLSFLKPKKAPPPEPAPPPVESKARDPLTVGTIGSRTLLGGVERQQLHGFGVVVGLGENGSSDCPSAVRDYLVEFMSKEYSSRAPADYRKKFSPSKLLDSLDTAVVEITAYVPGGASQGSRLDLIVEALAGSSTRSLEGGLLLPCELRIFTPSTDARGSLAGEVLAQAGGPIFINPFAADSPDATSSDPRRGYVLGGGRTVTDRTARLVLTEPSYAEARRIERRLNERFGQNPRTAEAQSRAYIELRTPPAFFRRPHRFLELAPRVYAEENPAFLENQLHELTTRMAASEGDLDRTALLLEAIGRRAISQVQSFYADQSSLVRFYAARTGLRLNDLSALPVLADLASSNLPERLLAVRELGACDAAPAALKLVPLLDSPDQEVRIAAYGGLLNHRHPAVRTIPVKHMLDNSQLNFALDVVESGGRPMIYVRRSGAPRIAVFGKLTPVIAPAFYSHPDDSVTVNAVSARGDVTLLSKRPRTELVELSVPPRVVELILGLGDLPIGDDGGRKRGLGLPYSKVVQVLAALCRDQTIEAPLVLEQTSLTELLGPDQAPERPESDEDASPPPSPVESAARPEDVRSP